MSPASIDCAGAGEKNLGVRWALQLVFSNSYILTFYIPTARGMKGMVLSQRATHEEAPVILTAAFDYHL